MLSELKRPISGAVSAITLADSIKSGLVENCDKIKQSPLEFLTVYIPMQVFCQPWRFSHLFYASTKCQTKNSVSYVHKERLLFSELHHLR